MTILSGSCNLFGGIDVILTLQSGGSQSGRPFYSSDLSRQLLMNTAGSVT